MRRRLVVGNWKMNGGFRGNEELLRSLLAGWRPRPDRSLAVCVPFPYLAQARSLLAGSGIEWGAQDVSEHASGAYTGEVAASMLRDFDARYAIVGHSERRQLFGETDELVGRKAVAALENELAPIVCVGETLAERDRGETEAVVRRQWDAAMLAIGERAARIVLAYEPVWAIGTGRNATPEQAQAVHSFLRGLASVAGAAAIPILYGGSVKAANARSLFAMPDVDGGLVGGASLDAREFLAVAGALD